MLEKHVSTMNLKEIPTGQLPVYRVEEQARELNCEGCQKGKFLDFDFTMAFQPLVDVATQAVFGYEGLVRGLNNESAYSVIQQVSAENIYRFDQTCRVKAIALAAAANITERLSINFMPAAVYKPDICIRTTLAAAEKYGLARTQITFEIVEGQKIFDIEHLQKIVTYYKAIGFRVAIDDFGSGHANLEWLARLTPDSIKLDMALVRDIDQSTRKQQIVGAVATLCQNLGIDVLAEGVETRAERDTLVELGITKQQGYYFLPPQFECFAAVEADKFR